MTIASPQRGFINNRIIRKKKREICVNSRHSRWKNYGGTPKSRWKNYGETPKSRWKNVYLLSDNTSYYAKKKD